MANWTHIKTIDEVIQALDGIIEWSIEQNSRIGYFAVLYHRVTCRVKDGISKNEFEDGPRMERLDVIFALRFIHAWEQWVKQSQPSQSWQVAFQASSNKRSVMLQHILLGINAHINLDLGIATFETMGGKPSIEDILNDFEKINYILASMVDEIEQDMSKLSPMIWLVDKFGKGNQDKLATFSIDIARTGAWYFACQLQKCPPHELKNQIELRDKSIANLASKLAHPKNWVLRFMVGLASLFEWRQPKKNIEVFRKLV